MALAVELDVAADSLPCSDKQGKIIQVIKSNLNHRITESQNGRGWKRPLWVI